MKATLAVNGLEKRYGTREVLRGLSFHVEPGETLGFLGSNGAGKTTTIRCIAGLARPDGGSVEISGRLGVQLQDGMLPAAMRVREAVELFARRHGTLDAEGICAQLGLERFWSVQYGRLSTGQKRTVQIAAALIVRPDLLLLDEPSAGLDAEARIALTSVLQKFRERGGAVLMASHNLREVEDMAERAIILKDGVCAWSGVPGQVSHNDRGEQQVEIRTADGADTFWAKSVGAFLIQKLQEYRQKGIEVLEVQTRRDSLLDTFLQVEEENT